MINAPRMCGFLNIYKTVGPTSFDCIRALKRIFRRDDLTPPKLGHLGTLDPLAEGVLPVAVGQARRLIRFYEPVKTYRAAIRLGLTTETDDVSGTDLTESDISHLNETAILAALDGFKGEIEQVPPKFSAAHSQGVKAYRRAREGDDFSLQPKVVRVDGIDLLGWNPPDLELRLVVGPGTYVRSLARDLGRNLDVGGCVATLVREADGPFTVADSLTLEELERRGVEGIESILFPPDFILNSFRRIDLSLDDGGAFCMGKKLNGMDIPIEDGGNYIRVYGLGGFIGVGVIKPDGVLKPFRVLKADRV